MPEISKMLGGVLCPGTGIRGLSRLKPGLMFLFRLAWESRARLPLLIMSGFMALGVRVQMEINIEQAASFMPRVRLQDEDESESSSEVWTSDDEFGYSYSDDSEYAIDHEAPDVVIEEDEEEYELASHINSLASSINSMASSSNSMASSE